ncbi:hypothetical protein LguiA_000981 [Lonicera macranthoides]
MENNNKKLPAEELLKKIQELEEGQAHLKQEMSKLRITPDRKMDRNRYQRSQSISPQRSARRRGFDSGGGGTAAALKIGSTSVRHSSPLQRESRGDGVGASTSTSSGGGSGEAAAPVKFSERQYLNILQSMGQGVHIWDVNGRIIYWNRSAERLYGYTSAEALGQNAVEFLVDPPEYAIAYNIIDRVIMGESWTGQFPLLNKSGEKLQVCATNTPFYDDDGSVIGVICVSSDSQPFKDTSAVIWGPKKLEADSSFSRPRNIASAKLGLDPQQPLQVAIASKISNLATKVSNKVKSKMRTTDNLMDREGGSGDSHNSDHSFPDVVLSDHREDAISSGDSHNSVSGVFSHPSREENSPGKLFREYPGDEGEGKLGLKNVISSKAEAWMVKKGISWPWKGNEREGSEARASRFVWPWLHNDQENESDHQKSSSSGATKPESVVSETPRPNNNEAYGSWSSSCNVNSTSSASSCGSTNSSAANKVDADSDSLDYEILWEDLTIGEQIGQGSCGTVYHALWYGSDVAVKVFSKQEYSDDVIHSFRQEVSLMKRLRHPNVLLFMGAVTSPQHLCIVTEFLPRSDVYSYGVVLWELVTEKIPWENLNSMQVIGAVGFMDHRLEIPKDVDPRWASIIESCWYSEPQRRPTFQELMEKLKELQRHYALQFQAARSTTGESGQKEL